MRVYVIGSEGQVARSLREAAMHDESVVFGHSTRDSVDLLQRASVSAALAAFRPDVVINPAAYTAVDKAESEPELAFAINRDAAGIVAAAAAEQGAPIIHFSTDYVFDGRKVGAYVETDPVGPQGVYGRSKLEGERDVADANPRHVILRTSWVYAPFGNNFVRTMLRLAAERERLGVVNDQIGCPTYAPDLAKAALAIAKRAGSDWSEILAGVTHAAGPDALSWCDFAQVIVEGAARRGARSVPVDPIPTSAYPTPAARPANSQLSTARLASVFGIRLRSLEHSLADCLDRLFEVRTGETS
jgi:dTDP-4-dehydrorhamnose reductase